MGKSDRIFGRMFIVLQIRVKMFAFNYLVWLNSKDLKAFRIANSTEITTESFLFVIIFVAINNQTWYNYQWQDWMFTEPHLVIVMNSSVFVSFDYSITHSFKRFQTLMWHHEPEIPMNYLCFSCCAAVKIKKPIQTKFRLPVLNWVALKPSQINGTIFNDIDDESILQVKLISV